MDVRQSYLFLDLYQECIIKVPLTVVSTGTSFMPISFLKYRLDIVNTLYSASF